MDDEIVGGQNQMPAIHFRNAIRRQYAHIPIELTELEDELPSYELHGMARLPLVNYEEIPESRPIYNFPLGVRQLGLSCIPSEIGLIPTSGN